MPGEHTRPTSARVKEAIFSIIQFHIEGRYVLDLFAGTGQMGIEALSRGAVHAVFLDNSRDAIAVILDNLKHTGLSGRATVVAGDALSYLRRKTEPFDVIFMDPPYHEALQHSALEMIASFDLLREGGILMCESATGSLPLDLPPPYARGRICRYGAQMVCPYRREQ